MSAQLAHRSDSRIEQLRIPPQAIDAEQAVLGGLMLVPRALHEISDMLTEADFYRRDHQLIWRAIQHCERKRLPFDAVTLGDWFESQGLSEQVAGGAYLIELASNTPSAANIRAYAEIVVERATRRKLIDIGTGIVNDAFEINGRETLELVGQAQTRVGSLLDSQPCELESVGPVMSRVFERLAERNASGGGIEGLTTGLTDLDDLLNGLKPGQLLVLAARPKAGKTSLAMNIAEHVAIDLHKAVAVFSFEMSQDEIGDRILSSQGDVDNERIRRGTLDETDWANASAAIKRLQSAKIFVTRPRMARVEHVCAQARRQHARTPLGLVVIDYLQLMSTGSDNRAQGIGDITRALKLLAVELGIPVLLLSQLNRDLEKRDNKRPIPADLRDSGAIEQDADVVIFIYRDEIYNSTSRYKGTAEIIVALQRNGPPGDLRALYRGDRFRFENLPFGWEPAPMATTANGTARRGMRKGNAGADAAAGDA
jgi:replicative DNA helicase